MASSQSNENFVSKFADKFNQFIKAETIKEIEDEIIKCVNSLSIKENGVEELNTIIKDVEKLFILRTQEMSQKLDKTTSDKDHAKYS